MGSPDPAALVAAAVRAACLAKAPRRTVQAVAAAVVSVFARPADARLGTTRGETAKDEDDREEVVAKSLEERREAIKAKRRAKRQRKRAAKAAAATVSVRESKEESSTLQHGSVGNIDTAVVASATTPTVVTPSRPSTVFAPECRIGYDTWEEAARAARMRETSAMQTDHYMSDTTAKRGYPDTVDPRHSSSAHDQHSHVGGLFNSTERPGGLKGTRKQPKGT